MIGILIDNDTNDLLIEPERDAQGKITKGLVLGDNTNQRIRLVVECSKGEFKERPTLGFGIQRFLKLPTFERTRFVRELMVEMESEGFPRAKIEVNNDLSEFKITT